MSKGSFVLSGRVVEVEGVGVKFEAVSEDCSFHWLKVSSVLALHQSGRLRFAPGLSAKWFLEVLFEGKERGRFENN